MLFPHSTQLYMIAESWIATENKKISHLAEGQTYDHEHVNQVRIQAHFKVSRRYRSKTKRTEKVYAVRTKKFTEQELKDKIKERWDEISVGEIRKSISS